MEQESNNIKDTILVHRDGKPIYPIILTDSFNDIEASVSSFNLSRKKVCIVADSQVAELYLDEVKHCYEACAVTVVSFVFPAGEQHKNLDTVRTLYEFLIQNAFDRNDMLVALGGGVTGDLTGFTAATYLRGIDFIQMPTTLLSQVDSSIGGKTGVDFDAYKNMVGAFYMPRQVYINVSVLKSLSEEQFSSGMGEVIKHGCIQSLEYYNWLSEHKEEVKAREIPAMAFVVKGSCMIKRAVVEEDPTEKGLRAILNFGHTLGHAIEKEKQFTMSHGACVSAGCVAAAWISYKRGMLSLKDLESLKELLDYFSLPTAVDHIFTKDILEAVRHDKKMDSGVIKFILLRKMGEAYIDRMVTTEEMAGALEYLRAEKERTP